MNICFKNANIIFISISIKQRDSREIGGKQKNRKSERNWVTEMRVSCENQARDI